jgi:hypothetical protein
MNTWSLVMRAKHYGDGYGDLNGDGAGGDPPDDDESLDDYGCGAGYGRWTSLEDGDVLSGDGNGVGYVLGYVERREE